MITVYCLRQVGEPRPPEGLAGPGGAAVRIIEEGEVGAWISEGAARADIDSVRAHDAVVRTALRSATPVPARFGTVFADEAELRESLRERAEVLRGALERVHGRVEMGVTVEWDMAPEAPRSETIRSGRAYLERRRAEIGSEAALRRRAERLLEEVEARVTPEGVPSVRTLLPARGVAGSVAHLVHRHAVGVYRSRVEEAQSHLEKVHLRVTGPWAPYSFV